MYGFEDGFEHFCGRLRVHWMWWPRSGESGLAWADSFSRGDWASATTTSQRCCAERSGGAAAGLILVKSLMWSFSLSSGRQAAWLAPILMIGAALGEAAAQLAHMPAETQALWALMAMERCSRARWAYRLRRFSFR